MNDLWTIVIFLLGIWTAISFIDLIFKTCMFHPYLTSLDRVGISISPGQLRVFTTAFNSFFKHISHKGRRFLSPWFNAGAVFGILAIIPCMVFLTITLINHVFSQESSSSGNQQLMVAIVPGINLPISQLVYYFLALIICSVIHEAGHAMAAYREGIPIQGVGFIIFAALPTAFVDISTQQLARISLTKQLRIFCAGIWHNLVLSLVCYVILLAVPIFNEPLYAQNTGVYITDIKQNASIGGIGGLFKGDSITQIDECVVQDVKGWTSCLSSTLSSKQGYCIPDISVSEAEIKLQDDAKPTGKNSSCCPPLNPSGLCFYTKFATLETSCLHARSIITESYERCNASVICKNPSNACVVPVLDGYLRLITLFRDKKESVIFIGHPGEVYQGVTVSNYIPRFNFIPARLPVLIETLLQYIISFSSGLCVLNVVPCLFLDGQHIARISIDIFLMKIIKSQDSRSKISAIVIIFGTALLLLNVVLALISIV